MGNQSSVIRGLINDLFRSLSAALIHVDELIMKLERNSDGFSDAILTNEQLSRSIELFLELRSECNYFREQLFVNKANSSINYSNVATNHFKHGLNELLTTVLGSCDLMLLDNNKDRMMNNITLIRNSIGHHLYLEEPIDGNMFCTDNGLKLIPQNKFSINYDTRNKATNDSETKNGKILLVEDDNEVRKITSIALYKEGYKVFESENAESAKNIFQHENADFNLCLIDLGLPDMNGAQLASELISTHKKLNILFTSGQDKSILDGHIVMLRKFKFLKKPYRITELISIVGKLCQ